MKISRFHASPYTSAIPISVAQHSRAGWLIAAALRNSLLFIWWIVCVLLGCLIAIPMFHSPDVPRIVCSFYSPVSAWLVGYTVVYRDYHYAQQFDGGAVFVSNHQTFYDIFLFGRNLPKKTVCVAKSALKYVPFFGFLWYAAGNIFVDRQDRSSAIKSLDEASKRLSAKQCSIWIFPEGTINRIDPETLLPFKKGAFHVAIQSGRPIVPVIASCQRYCFNRDCPVEDWHWRGGLVLVQALPPISTEGKTADDVNALLEETRRVMLPALEKLNAEARKLNGIDDE